MIITLSKIDPTKTLTLRAAFVADAKRRFKAITRVCNESIVTNDCFGLSNGKELILSEEFIYSTFDKDSLYPIEKNRYKFATTPTKITSFMEWLAEMERLSVFEVYNYPSVPSGVYKNWSNQYIRSAYMKGIKWGRVRIKDEVIKDPGLRADFDIPDASTAEVLKEFGKSVNVDRVAALYTRSFTDLKGITATMDAEISRILSSGLTLGESPLTIAKEISSRISAIGIHRATLMARTEIIRAHHLASIQQYREAGVREVRVSAEWLTAGDKSVCKVCSSLEGTTWPLDEIEGMIPMHVQCRCAAVPIIVNSNYEDKD